MSRFAAARPTLPRPNLGPEPWPESPVSPAWWALAVGLVLAAIVAAIASRRRHRARSRPSTTASGPPLPESDHREIAWAEAVRTALVGRFGTSWAARTTEEIAADESVAEAFGPEKAARIADLLLAADRLKFAGPESEGLQGEDWLAWVVGFVAECRAAGASSKSNGR